MNLTSCQTDALQNLESTTGNIFLTGSAGTGKSYLLQKFLRGKSRKEFPVLASTGAAAVLVGGRTFHSFFGLGILEGGARRVFAKAKEDQRLAKRLRKVSGFVIDEISMIPGEARFVSIVPH